MFRWTIGFLALLLTKWEKELSERLPWARGGGCGGPLNLKLNLAPS